MASTGTRTAPAPTAREKTKAKLRRTIRVFERLGLDGTIMSFFLVWAAHQWAMFGIGYYYMLFAFGFVSALMLFLAGGARLIYWHRYQRGFAGVLLPIVYLVVSVTLLKFVTEYLSYAMSH